MTRIRFKLNSFVKTRHPQAGDGFKHLTLSVASTDDLPGQVSHLVRSFRRLRHRSFMRKHCRGGAFVVEVTRSKAGWHAHLHIIIESAFIPWIVLHDEWYTCSGGLGCYIKAIPASAIITYLTKYLTKSELPILDRLECSTLLKGYRMFQPFGQWHKPITAVKVPSAVCKICGQSVFVYGDSWRNCIAGKVPDLDPVPPYIPQPDT